MRTEPPVASGRRGRECDPPRVPIVPTPGLSKPGWRRGADGDRLPTTGIRGLAGLGGVPSPTVIPGQVPASRWEIDGVKLDHEDLRLLGLLAEGLLVSSISKQMAMSDRTVRRRIRAICEQLGVKATVQAVVWAARRGLV